MNKILSGFAFIALGGLAIAILQQFGWDPFAAFEWAFSWVMEGLKKSAALWSSNETFQEVTKKPS